MIARLLCALALFAALCLPSRADAQGRCRCNMGCHQYPGQCVSRGGEGCEAGYAPFCGTRAGTCPSTGWVTCNGECTCVRLGPSDAGTTPVDASVDVTRPMDAPTPLDVAPPADRVAPQDLVSTSDQPRSDVQGSDVSLAQDTPSVGADAPSPRDAPVSLSDAPVSLSDAPVSLSDAPMVSTPDGGAAPMDSGTSCACDGGPCFNGFCPSTRCRFEMELGFICPLPGETCRVIGDEAWCVPACLDVRCPAGATCDPRTGSCAELACDAQRPCPSGARCVANRCEAEGDAAVTAVRDGATIPAVQDGGCGCRTSSRGGAPRGTLSLLALAAVARRLAAMRRGRTRAVHRWDNA